MPPTTDIPAPPTAKSAGAACGQAEVATDLGASTAYPDSINKGAAASVLRAKGEDLIGVGGRHREDDGSYQFASLHATMKSLWGEKTTKYS
jgi:hypothetical protein